MKIVATLSTVVLLGMASPALAQYERAPVHGVLPPFEIMTIVRSMGLDPVSRPVLRGPFYVVRALDDEDVLVRVALDARSGQVLNVTEGRPGQAYAGVAPERRFEGHVLPPETVPPGLVRPYDDIPPPVAQPPVRRPKVAARPPLPRPAPPESRALMPGIATPLPDPNEKPGKSIPAPVAKSATVEPAAPAPEAAPSAPAEHPSGNAADSPPPSATGGEAVSQ